MEHVLVRRLEQFSALGPEDKIVLSDALTCARVVPADSEIPQNGESSGHVFLLNAGIACQTKRAMNGCDAVAKYLLPGDFCNLRSLITGTDFTTLRTVTQCELISFDRETMDRFFARPNISKAMMQIVISDESLARGALLNVSSRRAEQRVAHFMCEMFFRLTACGTSIDDAMSLPFTQADFGRSLGISKIHINRALHSIRDNGMICIKRGGIKIVDIDRLQEMCAFDPSYLCG